MTTTFSNFSQRLCLVAAAILTVSSMRGGDILIKPSRGGALDTNAPMIHVDISYDESAHKLNAVLDTSYGIPKLNPLPHGYAFDIRSNYYILTGKAYSLQYAWNPGSTFTPPPGAAVWIERLSASPGLENYDGPGNKTENPPRPYTPILGTAGSPPIWKWYGRMAHNAYAIFNPRTNLLTAEFRVYFGDSETGARDAYTNYNDATVKLTWTVDPVPGQDVLANPCRGGGFETNAPMIHVDISYDDTARQLNATVDTTKGIPKLLPLPPGYAFSTSSNFYVLNGKAYNYQYAWNPGSTFTPPAGAAVWIERLSASPGLENYDGPGNKMESPPRPYTPILGTAGTPSIWKWYGRMAHNAYAIFNPRTNVLTSTFRVYFGDSVTGARDAYTNYNDATVQLTWTVDPVPEPVNFEFGATDTNNAAPLCFLNAGLHDTNSGYLENLRSTGSSSDAQFECQALLEAVAATSSNGGPVAGHAALGANLAMQLVTLEGPPNSSLSFWEAGDAQARFTVPAGEVAGANRIALNASSSAPGSDPYSCIVGRRFTVNQAGLYCLGFRLVDTSTNGPNGGPIHAPSALYNVYLQAGLTVVSLDQQESSMVASFVGEPGKVFYLERATQIGGSTSWETVAGPLSGINRLQGLTDAAAAGTRGFYRIRSTLP